MANLEIVVGGRYEGADGKQRRVVHFGRLLYCMDFGHGPTFIDEKHWRSQHPKVWVRYQKIEMGGNRGECLLSTFQRWAKLKVER